MPTALAPPPPLPFSLAPPLFIDRLADVLNSSNGGIPQCFPLTPLPKTSSFQGPQGLQRREVFWQPPPSPRPPSPPLPPPPQPLPQEECGRGCPDLLSVTSWHRHVSPEFPLQAGPPQGPGGPCPRDPQQLCRPIHRPLRYEHDLGDPELRRLSSPLFFREPNIGRAGS